MARYKITHASSAYGPAVTVEKVRKDHASDAFYASVYDAVKGWAGLDTAWGWAAARKANVVCADIERGVPIGWTDFVRVRDEIVHIKREA